MLIHAEIIGVIAMAVIAFAIFVYLICTSHRTILITQLPKIFLHVCKDIGKMELDFLKSTLSATAQASLIFPALLLLDFLYPLFQKQPEAIRWQSMVV